jgi:hypothetical protein
MIRTTASGTNPFHIGEIIPVELSFAASLPDSYDMDTRNYDRSGHLDTEQFHVTPPSASTKSTVKYPNLGLKVLPVLRRGNTILH